MAVKRIWHGWTTPEKADEYERLLRNEIIPVIREKNIPGYRGIEVLRREPEERTGAGAGGPAGRDAAGRSAAVTDSPADQEPEIEFITIMTFGSLDNVIAFQGEEYRKAYVPEKARAVLKRWDSEAVHYEVVDDITYG